MKSSRFPARHFALTLFALPLSSFLSATPAYAVAGDGDDDGVADALDVAPCNASVTNVVAFPAENQYATLAFEDQWPSIGDYDFNDLVLPYNVEIYRNAAGNASRVRYVFAPKAMGALFDNGLAVHLPVAASVTVSAQLKLGNGSFAPVSLEAGETDVVVRVAENVRATFFGGAAGQVNTNEANPTVTPTTAELVIDFATPIALDTAKAPFDVFIFRTGNFSHQIHATGELGTDKMDQTLWGSQDDNSKAGLVRPVNGKAGLTTIIKGKAGLTKLTNTFQDRNGVPFVLNLPVNAAFPQENRRVDALFPRIVDFATSAGAQFSNFHSVDVNTPVSFRNALAATPAVPTAAIREQSCIATVGSSASFAGASCKAIKDQGGSVGDGLYFIDPDGAGSGFSPMQVRCDMTTDGGGWTMLFNSSRFDIQGGSANNNSFWSIPHTQRFNAKGTPALDKDYYNGSLYLVGREYRDEIEDLANKTQLLFKTTATGINTTNMSMQGATFVSGNNAVWGCQFAAGWSAPDFDNDTGPSQCALSYNSVTQHYCHCWYYNLGSDADSSDATSHPHIHVSVVSNFAGDGSSYTIANRITRWARW